MFRFSVEGAQRRMRSLSGSEVENQGHVHRDSGIWSGPRRCTGFGGGGETPLKKGSTGRTQMQEPRADKEERVTRLIRSKTGCCYLVGNFRRSYIIH